MGYARAACQKSTRRVDAPRTTTTSTTSLEWRGASRRHDFGTCPDHRNRRRSAGSLEDWRSPQWSASGTSQPGFRFVRRPSSSVASLIHVDDVRAWREWRAHCLCPVHVTSESLACDHVRDSGAESEEERLHAFVAMGRVKEAQRASEEGSPGSKYRLRQWMPLQLT